MKNLKSILCATLIGLSSAVMAQTDYRIIPLPQSIEMQKGNDFVLNDGAILAYDIMNPRLATNATLLKGMMHDIAEIGRAHV